MIPVELEEQLGSGLRYTEETGHLMGSLPVRDCSLWQAGVDQPVSHLRLLSFRQRAGAVSIPGEGIGGVKTLPNFRRRGYIRTLLNRVLHSAAARVPVLFLSDAIEGLYEQFGCVTCLAEGHLSVPIRNVERARPPAPAEQIRGMSGADLPQMVALYNQAHARRPWTHERHAGWNQLAPAEDWEAGSEVVVLERGGRLAGYAALQGRLFGHRSSTFVVDELTAADVGAAEALLAELATRCWQLRLSEFRVHEPLDSAAGQAARRLGCTYQQTFHPSGGMMGKVLNRQWLLELLEPELRRRLPGADLEAAHTAAYGALLRGEIIADDRDLLRLLVGYWSAADLQGYGVETPGQYAALLAAWFPGGGARQLPLAYAHMLDRY